MSASSYSTSPLSLVITALESRGCRPVHTPNGYKAKCPAHDDNNPSLGVSEGDRGVVINCLANCSTARVVSALGLQMRDLFYEPLKPAPKVGVTTRHPFTGAMVAERFVAIYDYTDETGKLLFQVCRRPDKQFPQRRPDPDQPTGWTWKVPNSLHVPYKLPRLIAAVAANKTIFVPEGEKDVENCLARGLEATCNPGGAGKWRQKYCQYFVGARVVLLEDNDQPGVEHVQKAAAMLVDVVADLRILKLPGLPPKGDVSDWFAGGGTRDELERLAATAPKWQPPVVPPSNRGGSGGNGGNGESRDNTGQFDLTDVGNAHRLIRDFGSDLRYCFPWKRWFTWDGRRWLSDETGEIYRRAETTARKIYSEAAEANDADRAAALAKHAVKTRSDQKIKAMIERAKNQDGIPILPEQIDTDPWLLNCQNGTLDLRTGQLRAHRREDLLTKIINTNYDPSAECPLWLTFLDRILSGNANLISFLQRAVGYALTGNTMEKCLFFFYGHVGNNGKSTFLETITALLGSYALAKFPIAALLDDKHGNAAANPNVAQLAGVRFVSASEVGTGKKFNEELIKDLTGGIDTISAKRLYENPFTFKPTHKLFIYGNNKPIIQGTDNAIWNRLKMVPFVVSIPDAEQDKQLPDKLLNELPGILAWAVKGCLAWQRDGMGIPEEVKRATDNYRQEMDILAGFLSDRCVLDPNARVSAKNLYEAYEQWCKDNGERVLSQKYIGGQLTARGYERFKSTGGYYSWRGIGLVIQPAQTTPTVDELTVVDPVSLNSPRELPSETSRSKVTNGQLGQLGHKNSYGQNDHSIGNQLSKLDDLWGRI